MKVTAGTRCCGLAVEEEFVCHGEKIRTKDRISFQNKARETSKGDIGE